MGLFSRKVTATQLVSSFYNDVLTIAKESPLHDTEREKILQSEALPFVFLLFDSACFSAGKDRYKYARELQTFLSDCQIYDSDEFNTRIGFYAQFLQGKEAHAFYWMGHNPKSGSPIEEVLGAFCDMLYNPSLAANYDESITLLIIPMTDSMSFIQKVYNPLLNRVAIFLKDIRSLK